MSPKHFTPMLSLLAALGILELPPAHAGTANFDFSTDPSTTLELYGNNPQPWQSSGGDPGGFLALTYPENSQNTTVIFPDIDEGQVVTSFKFEADLRVGNSTGDRAADGFSISFARANDPLLADPGNNALFAGGIPEGGTTTGIAISFDTWSGNALPDGPDIEGIIVRVDNVTVLREPLPVRHGACENPDSLQTGPRDPDYWTMGLGDPQAPESWATLCWQPFSVEVDEQGRVTVTWKGETILDQFQSDFFPSPGRIVMAGRTGGSNEHTHVDNISLATTATSDSAPPSAPSNLQAAEEGARRILLTWDAATDDSGRVGYEVEKDGQVLSGIRTEARYEEIGLKPGTTIQYRIRATDAAQNTSAWVGPVSVTTGSEVDNPCFLLIEFFEGISGTDIFALLDDPNFPDNPTGGTYINGLDFFPGGHGDNYGAMVKGTLTPIESGNYDFFLRSDDASQFFLNTSGPATPDPFFTFPLLEELDCCDPFMEPETGDLATTFSPVSLTAGQKYGFLLVLKEGGGGDWFQVAWRKAGDTTPAAQLPPLGGTVVEGVGDPVGAVVNITQPPQDTTAVANSTATFTVAAETASPYTDDVCYQWFRNGNPIPGAHSAELSLPLLSMSDNGDKFSVLVGVPGKSATTSEATLTVTADTAPPTLVSGLKSSSRTRVIVKFSEALNETSAEQTGNYTLTAGGSPISVTGAEAEQAADSSTVVTLTTAQFPADQDLQLAVTGVTDLSGNAVAAGSSLTITETAYAILMAVGTTPPNASDQALIDHLEGSDFEVTWVEDTQTQTSDADGKDLIILSSTCNSGDVTDKYTALAIPIINWEQALQDDLLLTANDGAFRGTEGGQTQINVVNAEHPLAMGLSDGLNTIMENADTFSWGIPADNVDANIIATMATNPDRAIVYFVDTGGILIDGSSAPARRIHLFSGDDGYVNANAAGRRIFHSSVNFALDIEVEGPPSDVTLSISRDAGTMTVAWEGGGTLQSATQVTGPWSDVDGATSPHSISPTEDAQYFRVAQ